MDWSKGYSASYYAAIVDPSSWRDIERLEIISGNVNKMDSELRHSAEVTCVDYEQQVERWIRIYLDAKQGHEIVHVPLFTGITSTPAKSVEGNRNSLTLQCYSVLKTAEDIVLPRGWYAPSGGNGAQIVKQLLGVSPAPIEVAEESPLLKEAIVAEDNESNLSMVNKILTAIGWRIKLDGNGVVYVLPQATEPSASFDPLSNDSIEPQIEIDEDYFSCPNVFLAVSGDVSAIARDDSEKSMLSTVNRGREVWAQEMNCELNEGETVAEYATRRLKEEQRVAYTVKYSRRFDPSIEASDLIRLDFTGQSIQGTFRVVSQAITLEYGARTSEEVVRI